MKPAMRLMLVAVVAASLLASGCSFVFVQSPHVVEGKVECTREFTLPLVDAAVGVTGIVTPFILEQLRDRSVDDPNMVLYVGMWAAGVAGAVSSIVGITKVKRCRRTVSAPTPAPAAPVTV